MGFNPNMFSFDPNNMNMNPQPGQNGEMPMNNQYMQGMYNMMNMPGQYNESMSPQQNN